jgi:S1-C subfamily serine protease
MFKHVTLGVVLSFVFFAIITLGTMKGYESYINPSVSPLEAARDSSVKVGLNGPGHGSGVVLTADGLVLTNAHVCESGGKGLKVWDRWDHKYDAEILWMSETEQGYDFCVLQVIYPEAEETPLPWDWRPVTFGDMPDLGDEIFHIGNMMNIREMISWGRAGQPDDLGDEGLRPAIRYMGTAGPGSSGGGVFNEEGELIGILTWGYHLGAQRGRGIVRIPVGVAAFQPIQQFLTITGR